jgi:hypothetical protein
MAGHSRPKDGVASLAYVPAIHALPERSKTWMPGGKLALGPAEGRTRVAGHDDGESEVVGGEAAANRQDPHH